MSFGGSGSGSASGTGAPSPPRHRPNPYKSLLARYNRPRPPALPDPTIKNKKDKKALLKKRRQKSGRASTLRTGSRGLGTGSARGSTKTLLGI